ncbi:MAG: hypothetical protein JO029_02160 [Candidatus Eremiobacteraeota bacterium]|nr:hypothetical protein [Candidatus Eremiobacteraeota bacterium]MBV8433065.1 hypothetical protein [Candidatus Eremiobacteraeota bacterium]
MSKKSRFAALEEAMIGLQQAVETYTVKNDAYWTENQRRWDENDRRWDENDRRWDENDRRWERNDRRLTNVEDGLAEFRAEVRSRFDRLEARVDER